MKLRFFGSLKIELLQMPIIDVSHSYSTHFLSGICSGYHQLGRLHPLVLPLEFSEVYGSDHKS